MGYLSCRAQSAISVANSQTSSSKTTATATAENPIKIQHFDYSDLVAATNGFSDQKLLGKGSHGYVYKAVLRGRLVAVKRPSRAHSQRLRPTSSSGPETANEVDNELEILSKIQSPRLVNLLGFSNDSKERLLVVEFMSNGTLYDVLHSSTNRPPNWGRRIRLALQTAKAIDILHSSNPPVIHRDIKSANVLIDRSYNARLGDFGLALRYCQFDEYRLRSTPPAGTMGYLDPCYVTPDNLSTKTDVFSFGILLLEIISGRKAIDVGHSPPSIVDWAIPLIKRGKLTVYDPRIVPPKDPVVRKQLAVIAAKCVRSCRERRPSMKEVVIWLTGLSKLVPLHSWNGFNNPCTMVETMGRPVESRNAHMISKLEGVGEENLEALEAKLTRQALRNSRRVYSDLGFSSNLMELMAGTDGESEFHGNADGDNTSSKSANLVSRFGSARYIGRSNQSTPGNGKGVPDLMQNHSFGKKSFTCSRRDDAMPHVSSNSRAAASIQLAV